MNRKWVTLTSTMTAVFMSALDRSIVVVSLPAIFRGIDLDPLAPGNVGYLIWTIMAYALVRAILPLALGRFGDMFGNVRIYRAGFVVFTLASLLLSLDPFEGQRGAMWLIGFRIVQAFGASMLAANAAAILTDAFAHDERGFAFGVNRIAGFAGHILGLVAGGVLAFVHWQAVFWLNVPIGIVASIWAYRMLRDGSRERGPIDWLGNVTFAGGLGALLIGTTLGIEPSGTHDPAIVLFLGGGAALLALFAWIEASVRAPMLRLGLFRNRVFAAGTAACFALTIALGGMQLLLALWLQLIWLPLHGFNYEDTPLYATVYALPLSVGYVIAGPISGRLSDRYGPRAFTAAGALIFGVAFLGLMSLPVDFSYPAFAASIFIAGIGVGTFGAPNMAAIMSSVPAAERGAASGVRSTFQNAGASLSVGLFIPLAIAGLASALPQALATGLVGRGVPEAAAYRIAASPPASSLYAAFLGMDPVRQLLVPDGVFASLPVANRLALTSHDFFPRLIAEPFHRGLVIVFGVAAVVSLLAALASYARIPRMPASADETPVA